MLCEVRLLHAGSAITCCTNRKWNCNFVCNCQEDTQTTGYLAELLPSSSLGEKPALFSLETIDLKTLIFFKWGLSRCFVKDDDLPSVYTGFCSFQYTREEKNLITWDLLGLQCEAKIYTSLNRDEADSRLQGLNTGDVMWWRMDWTPVCSSDGLITE